MGALGCSTGGFLGFVSAGSSLFRRENRFDVFLGSAGLGAGGAACTMGGTETGFGLGSALIGE